MLFWSTALAADLLVGPGQAFTEVEPAVSSASSGDVIVIDPGTYTVPAIQLGGRDLTLRSAQGPNTVTLMTQGATSWYRINGGGLTLVDLTIDAGGLSRLVDANNADVEVRGCTLRGGNTSEDGALIDIRNANTVIIDSILEASTTSGAGGLVHTDSDMSVSGSTFRLGTAAIGGAIAHEGNILTISDSTFTSNVADAGAAVHSTGNLSISNSRFETHTTGLGTVWSSGAQADFEGLDFEGNTGPGASLHLEGANASIADLTLCANDGSDLVDLAGGSTSLDGLILFDNTVTDGTLSVAAGASAQLDNAHILRNTASSAGAALKVQGDLILRNALIAHNTGPGAAVHVDGGTVTATYNLYFSNSDDDSDQPYDATEIQANPLLLGTASGTCDFTQLQPNNASPIIDAGDPALLDDDGSRSDIGVFGTTAVPVDPIDDDGDGSPLPADCDDTNPAINPNADEVACNGIDEDCDGSTPDDTDADGDGVSVCGLDCDDNDAERTPGSEEVPYDGVDQDCDGDDLTDVDLDGSHFPDDCDDNNAAIFPFAGDEADDGIDQDCTGFDATEAFTGRFGLRCSTGPSAGSLWWLALLLPLTRRSQRSS